MGFGNVFFFFFFVRGMYFFFNIRGSINKDLTFKDVTFYV